MNQSEARQVGMYRAFGKRAVDLVITVPALILAIPVMAIVAVVVRVRLGSPVIFEQVRPGLRGRPFTLRKFRSMAHANNSDGAPLSDAERLTPFGRRLRSTSLDELPELLNVLSGEMSLVGPRPLLMSYLPLYSPEQARRHEVRPGLTGWAQVNGRNAITWEDKFMMDTWYVDHVSFRLDMRILWRTVTAVFSRAGVTSEDHDTSAPFTGQPDA